MSDTAKSYNVLVDAYVLHVADELRHKPFDRALLGRIAAESRGIGRLCDLGCGPGHVAQFLKESGADVFGIDLSPEMVECARRLHPEIPFEVGDMRALSLPDADLPGIGALYSIIHLDRSELRAAFTGFFRALKPGGVLLLAFHTGEADRHLQELWGCAIDLTFVFHDARQVEHDLLAVGFVIEESLLREPYPDVEAPTRRAYIVARRPPA
ncbi:MAG: class I SAM-dependent methyltransferase [Armatimonadetes bacterium]|nr:class I SAM-dependent methyltransferase [Armatimonadota bacterium]MDE2206986.1 class I SAM-dependent methyltransferase [Armatimonadota bacterium]